MMGARILAVISAILLVAAFAAAVLLPPLTTLGRAISMYDHGWLVALQDTVRNGMSEWVWAHLVVPLLVRPAWFMPAGLGMVVGGVAVTVSSRRGTPRSHRRRS